MRTVLTSGRFKYAIPDGKPGDTIVELASATTAATPTIVAAQQPATPSRHQRRKNEVFNRRLKRRLDKDGTPANVEVLPDGGIHVTVKTTEEET